MKIAARVAITSSGHTFEAADGRRTRSGTCSSPCVRYHSMDIRYGYRLCMTLDSALP